MRQRRRIKGFTDLGEIKIPPLHRQIAMVDAADGVVWYLIFQDSHVGLTDSPTLPIGEAVSRYGADAGPYISSNPRIRLVVSGGNLGYTYDTDLPPGLQDRDQGRILTRTGVTASAYEIVEPEGWEIGEALGYEEVEL